MIDKNYIFDFGKYEGRHINEILNEDPSYIIWMSGNNFDLCEEILNEAESNDLNKKFEKIIRKQTRNLGYRPEHF